MAIAIRFYADGIAAAPEAAAIRKQVFTEEQGFKEEFDALDETAVHLVLFIDGEAAGTARLYPDETKADTVHFGRIAVQKAHRGKQLGAEIMRALEQYALQKGFRTAVVSAQERVRGFYASLGYRAEGGIYYDEFCPHIKMIKRLEGNAMFREMRRKKQQLPAAECETLLRELPRGVLSVHGDDGYPYGIPMDFVYADGCLYFHCAKSGHKLDAIRRDAKVSFCVYDEGFRKEGDWALNIRSVVVFGEITEVTDEAERITRLRALGMKYYPDAADVEHEIERDASRALVLCLKPAHITGKLVNEK